MAERQPCRNLIVMALLRGRRLGFEGIVREVGYSRGAVNNNLRALYKDGLIEQESGRGFRKYYLSKLGKTEAGRLSCALTAYQVVYNGEDAAEIKSKLEELQKLINLALSKYDNDLSAFFSCCADLSLEPVTGVFKFSRPGKNR